MTGSGEHSPSQTVDLCGYAGEIVAQDDLPIFEEAVRAAGIGALRAAYMMIWLACAESLKRRFREAKLRDNTAGKVVGEIEKLEKEHRAIDKYLLDQAYEYGFLSDSGQAMLNQVYEMRCLYAHPYQEAPSPEKVTDAAATVVNLVLSKPVKLKHGYGRQLLDSLLKDANFLDDHKPAVAAFAKSVLPRLDEGIYVWLLDEYWKELEKISGDASVAVFSRRGIWFCRTMLADVGPSVFSPDEWHDRAGRFPRTLVGVCCIAGVFQHIGERAQDSLVGSMLEESKTQARVLAYLEELDRAGALSPRQQERFKEGVLGLGTGTVQVSGLSTKASYPKLVSAMKSRNWYRQNPAIDMVASNGPDQVAELTEEQQVELGRNILQCGEGSASSAIKFLKTLSHEAGTWPFHFLRGITLESFTNETHEIRLKCQQLDLVLPALSLVDSVQRSELVDELAASVDAGTVKRRVNQEIYNATTVMLSAYEWAAPLVQALEAKIQAQ